MNNDGNIVFEPDESLVMRSERVGSSKGLHILKNTLVLTTKNLYFVECGILGTTKEVHRYPLSTLVVNNGVPQAFYRRSIQNLNILDIYFTTGQESFVFQWKQKVKKWVESINELVASGILSDTAESIPTVYRFCSRCEASVKGHIGESVKCEYCGAYVSIE